MKVNKFKDLIVQIEDFMSEDEQQQMLDYIHASSSEDWHGIGQGETWENNVANFDHELSKVFYKRLEDIFYGAKGINPLLLMHRFEPGNFIGDHLDNMEKASISFGVVIYINDDYEGGEIVYPELDLQIKPKARSLGIHPGNLLHHTNPVIGNKTRYMVTSFVHGHDTKIKVNGEHV